jgi:hypothetical protein
MYRMRISTTKVTSVMLKPNKLEIRGKNVKTVKEPGRKIQAECYEIEPNLSKDRAMHMRDKPSF